MVSIRMGIEINYYLATTLNCIHYQRRLEAITCTIPSDDVMQKSLAERSNIAAPLVILCTFSSFLK